MDGVDLEHELLYSPSMMGGVVKRLRFQYRGIEIVVPSGYVYDVTAMNIIQRQVFNPADRRFHPPAALHDYLLSELRWSHPMALGPLNEALKFMGVGAERRFLTKGGILFFMPDQ